MESNGGYWREKSRGQQPMYTRALKTGTALSLYNFKEFKVLFWGFQASSNSLLFQTQLLDYSRVSPESLLEKQIPWPSSDQSQYLHFNKIPRWLIQTLKFERYFSNQNHQVKCLNIQALPSSKVESLGVGPRDGYLYQDTPSSKWF